MVVVTGNWCEGESRSGRPVVGVWRLGWNSWHGFLNRELAARQSGQLGLSGLPVTSTDQERWCGEARHNARRAWYTVAIMARQWHTADALRQACRAVQLQGVWIASDMRTHVRQLRAVIYDVSAAVEDDLPHIRWTLQAYQLPVLLVVGFPRPQQWQLLGDHPVRILSKPYTLTQLRYQVEQALLTEIAPAGSGGHIVPAGMGHARRKTGG